MKKTVASCSLLGLFLFANICGVTREMFAGDSGSDIHKVLVGFHEFEMFGDKSIFLSHYPMFGSIHSYQVLVEAVLKSSASDDPKQLYLAHKQKNPTARYSVSPESSSGEPDYWVLPDVIQAGKSFRANIHYQSKENHLVYLARNVTVEVTKVIYFRLFEPTDKKPDQLTYLLFGTDSETYMAHYIGSYPDFDQVLAVTIVSKNPPLSQNASPVTIAILGRDDSKQHRLVEKDKKIVGQVDGKGSEVEFDVVNQVHYEANLEIQR